jgi:hypothetical protein
MALFQVVHAVCSFVESEDETTAEEMARSMIVSALLVEVLRDAEVTEVEPSDATVQA